MQWPKNGKNGPAPLRVTIDAATVHAMAKDLFSESPWLLRHLQLGRLAICPFEELMAYVPAGASVLDIGCGRGLFLGLLAGAKRGIRGVGVDMAESAIQAAALTAKTVRSRGLGEIEFRIASHESLPEGPFEIVSAIDVLHHVPVAQQMPFLTAAAARLAPGGLLLYKDMVLEPLWRVLANRFHDLVVARELIHEIPFQTVLDWGAQQGLECVSTGKLNRYWYGHEFAIFRKKG